jgi:hypothetical protein
MCTCDLLLFEYASLTTLPSVLPYRSLARPHLMDQLTAQSVRWNFVT